MENFEYHILRYMIKKEEGDSMMMKFNDVYKEFKVEVKRDKTIEAHYMGSESLSRQRYQWSQSRNGQERGRPWNRDRDRGRSRSFGGGSRGYHTDSRRSSQNRNFGQGASEKRNLDQGGARQYTQDRSVDRGDRSRSRNRIEGENTKQCIGCRCKVCESMRKMAQSKV